MYDKNTCEILFIVQFFKLILKVIEIGDVILLLRDQKYSILVVICVLNVTTYPWKGLDRSS